MVALDVAEAANIRTVRAQPLVAVVVGGTAGIGECAVRELASTHADQGQGLRVYIVGRNQAAAEKIIADCSTVCPRGDFRFVRASDLSLLTDVDRVCVDITDQENQASRKEGRIAKVDFLVTTQGVLSFAGRNETAEGIDFLMSLYYYSRMRFIIKLMPLLLNSPKPAHFVSILNPKLEGKMTPGDLSVRDPNASRMTRTYHCAFMTRFFLEALAARYPGKLALCHQYPGAVMTQAIHSADVPLLLKWLWRFVIAPLWRPFSVSLRESGQRTIFLLSPRFAPRPESGEQSAKVVDGLDVASGSDGKLGSGAYRVNWNGETIREKEEATRYREQGMVEKVWEHTVGAFAEIEAGRVFRG